MIWITIRDILSVLSNLKISFIIMMQFDDWVIRIYQLIDSFMKDLTSDNDRSAISDILGRIFQMGNLWRFRIAASPGCWTCRVVDFAHYKTSRYALFQKEYQNTGENVWIWLGCDGGGIFSRVASYWTGLVSEVPCA